MPEHKGKAVPFSRAARRAVEHTRERQLMLERYCNCKLTWTISSVGGSCATVQLAELKAVRHPGSCTRVVEERPRGAGSSSQRQSDNWGEGKAVSYV